MENMTVIFITALAAFAAGFALCMICAKMKAKLAEKDSKRIIENAELIAESIKKDALLEAKLILAKERKEFKQEIK